MAMIVAGWLCASWSSQAAADKTYPVLITSEPSGASVWIGDREGKPVGKTPYSGSLPAGTHMVFVELAGYEFAAGEIEVRGQRRKQRFSFTLEEQSKGSIDVLPYGEAVDGATVFLDGKEVGTVPDTFEVTAGSHQLEVVKEGFRRYEALVKVGKGEAIELSVTLEPETDEPVTKKPARAPAPTARERVRPAAAKAQRAPLIGLRAGLATGARSFSYQQPRTGNLRSYDALGVVLVDIGAQLFASGLGSSPLLRPLSLFGSLGIAVPFASSTDDGGQGIGTRWLRREVGLRVELPAGPGSLVIDAAEGGNAFSFSNAGEIADELPQVAYEYVRLGAAYGMELGDYRFGAGADALIVIGAGDLAERFAAASVRGARARAWAGRALGERFEAALAASFTEFWYTFEPSATYDADGARDRMIDLSLTVAYRF